MKKTFMNCNHDYAGLIQVEVLASAKGWSMVRRKGAMPFCVKTRELSEEESKVKMDEDAPK